MEGKPKALVIAGGVLTVRVAEAVLPLPASVESIVTLLLKTPSVVACTLTVIVQVPTGNAGFEKLMVPDPEVAVTVPPPRLQLFTTLGVVATTRFAGIESTKLALIVVVFPFVTLNVMVLAAFTAALVGLKLFVIAGGCRTMIVAVAVCWSTTAFAEPVPPTPPAVKVAVACALAARASGCASGMVPRTGLLKVIGSALNTARLPASAPVL